MEETDIEACETDQQQEKWGQIQSDELAAHRRIMLA
jgi:hypothetical protein